MNRAALQKLARSLCFPPGRWADDQGGLRAKFDGAEDLVRLGWETGGQPDGTLWLRLWPQERRGRLTWPRGSGGTPDTERYQDGAWELFDAWSDNTRPQRLRWSAWTQRAATRVMDWLRCLLCGASLSEGVGAHTADARGHLCRDCHRRLADDTPTPRQWPRGDRVCAACHRDHDDEAPLFEGPRGKLCPSCQRSLRAQARPRWLPW